MPPLGDLEIAVLEDIWRFGASDAKTVYARVGRSRSITLNTVQSTLERLFRKRILQREKISHAYEYSAKLSRSELIHKMVESTVRRVAGPQPDALLSAFFKMHRGQQHRERAALSFVGRWSLAGPMFPTCSLGVNFFS